MDEDLYETGGSEHDESDPHMDEKGRKHDGKTALINSDICAGMQPGDIMEVRIERVLDGEYEVSYNPEGRAGDHDEEGKPTHPEMQHDSEMASYMD